MRKMKLAILVTLIGVICHSTIDKRRGLCTVPVVAIDTELTLRILTIERH